MNVTLSNCQYIELVKEAQFFTSHPHNITPKLDRVCGRPVYRIGNTAFIFVKCDYCGSDAYQEDNESCPNCGAGFVTQKVYTINDIVGKSIGDSIVTNIINAISIARYR